MQHCRGARLNRLGVLQRIARCRQDQDLPLRVGGPELAHQVDAVAIREIEVHYRDIDRRKHVARRRSDPAWATTVQSASRSSMKASAWQNEA